MSKFLIAPPASACTRDANGVLHVVALSGGKDSSAMALRLCEMEPTTPFIFVCTPTGDELPDMIEHWKKLGDLLGSRVWPLSMGKSLSGLIRDFNSVPNFRQRWCTRILKIEPFAAWLSSQTVEGSVVSYVGLRADEPDREGGDYAKLPGIDMRFPLREWGWNLDDVVTYLAIEGVDIPRRTDCARCYHQTLHEWYLLWSEHPDIYREAEVEEILTGHTLRSPGRDTWPSALTDLGSEFAKGRIPAPRKRATQCRVCAL